MSQPNLLVLMVDQMAGTLLDDKNIDHLHIPNMRKLIDRGVKFDNAYTSSPLCTPARGSFMTGQLQLLKDMLDIQWSEYTVLNARSDMRHCRDTCAVYRQLGVEADLTKLEAGQKEYKGHRRVVDGATNVLKAAVMIEDMTEAQIKKVNTVRKVRVQKEEKDADLERGKQENLSKRRRRDHIEHKKKNNVIEDKRKGNGKGGENVQHNLKNKE